MKLHIVRDRQGIKVFYGKAPKFNDLHGIYSTDGDRSCKRVAVLGDHIRIHQEHHLTVPVSRRKT